MSNSSATFKEGLGYYIAAGRWVFTAAYHLKRGHCCQNVCRHRPFGNSPTDHKNAVNGHALKTAKDTK